MDTHIAEYYSVMKKNKILPFAAKGSNWRELCLVKQVRERKTDTIWYHLYVES